VTQQVRFVAVQYATTAHYFLGMETLASPGSALTLLNSLTSDQIQQRLTLLEAEQKALRVLLRSVRARERAANATKTGTHGSNSAGGSSNG
jgi:hypothetical protein